MPGKSPHWNERLVIKLASQKDEQPNMQELCKEDVRIELFDFMKFQQLKDDRNGDSIEKDQPRFLCAIDVPLQSIMSYGNVEHVIRMETPPFQLSYSLEKDIFSPIDIEFFIKLNPPTKLPEDSIFQDSRDLENPVVAKEANDWFNQLQNLPLFKQRRKVLMARTTDNFKIFVFRMVQRQNFPPKLYQDYDENNKDQKFENQLIRYVAAIPNISDSTIFETEQSVWMSSQKFLNENQGDQEEHALLLCNYLLTLGFEAYVVLGHDIVQGNAAFVYFKKGHEGTYLVDPIRGIKWKIQDSACSMFRVSIAFNHQKIYANVQNKEKPSQIEWNFETEKFWKPFPPKGIDIPLQTGFKIQHYYMKRFLMIWDAKC